MEDRISKKILFYSPYGNWYPHTVWEITIAHALKIRGHKVNFVACDGVYSECDVHWAATAPRNEDSCSLCMRVSSHVYSSLKTSFQWIGRYINEEDRVKARSWADSLKDKEMFEAEYKDYPLGKWVKSSVHSHFRMNKLDLEDEKIVRAYRDYLYGAALAVEAFKKVFDSFSPEILVMLNGRFFSHRVAMELAKERGIRVVVHERGHYDNTLSFFENETCHSKRPITEIWEKWKDSPLAKKELCKIHELLENRKKGKNTGWHPFNKDWEESLTIKSRLGLPNDKKIVTLFISSPDELAASEGYQKQIFSSQIKWIKETVDWIKGKSKYHLVIRVHPNIDGTMMGANLLFLQEIKKLASNLSENVTIIMPRDKINSYALMKSSIAGITYVSTAGLEMATLGLPVLCVGKSYYYGCDFVYSLDRRENYIKLLEHVVQTPKSSETRKLAYRFAYHYFFTLSIPMSKVDNINYRDAEIKYKSIDELGPGKDEDLDRIVDFIISGKSLYPKPLGRDIDVLKKEEDNFFEELEKKDKLYDVDNIAFPHVSVIIPCYNYGRYLSDAVNSVLAQTYDNFEIIIVNDGSTDNSKKIAEQLIIAHPNRQIILINQKNSGQPAYSRNRGISKARGKYILCLDADDMITPTMLEECVNLLENDRSIAIAYTDRQDFDGVDQVVQAGNYDFSRLIYANHISYCALFGKEVWMEVGGYRTNVKGCEDWDFWIAAGARGYFGRRIPKPLFLYRRHDTGIYQEVIGDFKNKFARVILNNRELYRDKIIAEAEKLLAGSHDKLSESEPMVSVIIPTHDRPEMLADALKSVLNQTYRNFEIIVINDGEADFENIVSNLNQKGNITYVRHNKNKGVSAARNTGIKIAKGKYIAYLDDDDIFYSDHLETLVDFLENSEYKVAYTDAYRALQASKGNVYEIIQRDILYSIDFSKDLLSVQNIAPVQCFMHEKSCFDEVDLFDEGLTTHEDWDMWIKLSRKFDFKHIKKVTSEFRSREDGSNMTSSKRVDFLRTLEIIYQKYKEYAKNKPYIIEAQKISLQNLKNEIYGSRDRMKCSIIIPVFNQLEYTKQCLEALVQNTPDDLYEVIIVDNASTDGTKEFLKCLEGDVKIITNEENLGFAKACNQGAKAASSDYLLFLNNDTEVQSGWLEPLVSVLDADPAVAAVGSKMLFPDRTIQHAGVIVFDDQKLPDPLVARHIYYGQNEFFTEANFLREYQVLTAACLLVRKNIYKKTGGFDEKYWNGYEDVDLCFNIQKMGKKLVYQPQSIVIHHESKSGHERFRKVNQNIELLHSKWLGKIKPDFVITPDGEIHSAGANKIRPYRLADSKETSVKDAESLVSVIILTHNQLEYTKKCIDSIFKYTKEPFELIVVDNGSTDGTVEYLKRAKSSKLKAKNSNFCEGFKIIENKENRGFAMGNNQGMAIAKGDYVLLLNNDVVVTPGWLERMLAKFKEDEKIGIVGPRTNYVVGPQLVPKVTYSDNDMKGMQKFAKKWSREHAGRSFEIDRVIGFCMLVGRDVVEKIGGLDARFGSGNFEDDDFCLRAHVAGYKIVVADDVFVHHFGSRTFIGAKIDYRCSVESNWVKFKNKWGISPDRDIKKGYIFQELLAQSFDPRKHYQPLKMDEYFNPTAKPLPISDKRSFSFLMLPDWSDGEDKWSKALLEYIKAFNLKDDVSLILRVEPEQGETAEVAQEKLVSLMRCAGHDPENIPDIVIVDQLLTDNEKAGLFAAADVFVSTGELNETQHLLEAKACGVEILEDVSAKGMRAIFSANISKKK